MRVRLVLEYRGAAFHGWQIQPNVKSVQGELTKVVRQITRQSDLEIIASGRTDVGVHARGQVVHLDLEQDCNIDKLAHGINGLMRGELSVLYADQVEDSFHARFSADTKQYSYLILTGSKPSVLNADYAWHKSASLDVDKMQQGAEALIGEHDFKSFQAANCNAKTSVRKIISSSLEVVDAFLVYRVVGTGFLKQMVRTIVGTLVEIGEAKIEQPLGKLIADCDRKVAGMTAPAHGLYLDWVKYPDFPFKPKVLAEPILTSEVLGRRPRFW